MLSSCLTYHGKTVHQGQRSQRADNEIIADGEWRTQPVWSQPLFVLRYLSQCNWSSWEEVFTEISEFISVNLQFLSVNMLASSFLNLLVKFRWRTGLQSGELPGETPINNKETHSTSYFVWEWIFCLGWARTTSSRKTSPQRVNDCERGLWEAPQ